MPLQVEVRGAGPPLALLHGFTQTGRLWGSFGERLAEEHTLVAVDLPGHGGSAEVRADLPTTAALVAEAVRGVLGDETRCDLLGYSLGARVALHVATGTELALHRCVLLGGTAGIEDPAARLARRWSDEAAAERLEVSGDVAGFVDEWLRRPMFARLSATGDASRTERLRNGAAGLASSLRLCGAGAQEPLWTRLSTLEVPLLALAGSDDTRFALLALRMARAVPHGVASLVPGGGHALHLAQPALAARLVSRWLAATA